MHMDVPRETSSPADREGEEHRLDVVSDVERDIDKQARLAILLRLFKLACAMVREILMHKTYDPRLGVSHRVLPRNR